MQKLLLALTLLTISTCAMAAELTVPTQYSTLKLAIEAASSGDIITLEAGTYNQSGFSDLDIDAIALTIQGPASPSPTAIIDCNGTEIGPSRLATVKNDGQLDLANISIINGFHTSGGAILVTAGTLSLSNCSITNCQSESTGGAIAISSTNSQITINSSSFSGNSAEDNGGAISIDGDITTAITNSTFTTNSSNRDGGAIAIENNTSGLLIDTCSFTDNYTWDFGGAVAVETCSTFEIANSLIAGNFADSYSGGLYFSNTPYSQQNANDNRVINCTITENLSGQGASGIKLFNTEAIIANSIIYNNDLYGSVGNYKEISVDGDSSQILMAHSLCRGFDEFFNDDDSYHPEYCFIHVGSLLTDLGANNDSDPNFTAAGSWLDTDWTSGTYTPSPTSFCYNNGLNDYNSENRLYDLAGDSRLQANYIDIGCYELPLQSGPDLTGSMAVSLRYIDEIIPGDRGRCTLTLDNIGDADLLGSFPIRLYYSADKYIDSGDTLLAESRRDLRVRMLAARPRSIRYAFAFTIPGDTPAGTYYLLAELDTTNITDEADRSLNSNVIASDPLNVYWKFGTFGNRRNAVLALPDSENNNIRYVLKFGSGEVASNRSDITITSESERCMLTVLPLTRGVTPKLGSIECDGSFSLNARKCNLTDDIHASGVIPKLLVNDVIYNESPVTVTVDGSSENARLAMTFYAANVSDLNLFSENFPIALVKVTNWLNTSGSHPQLQTPWLRSMVCYGDFEADMTLTGENAIRDIALTAATVRGNINNCQWIISGIVRKVYALTVNDFDLLVGVTDGVTTPTGSAENDIANQYSLYLYLANPGLCMTNSTVITWELTKFAFRRGAYTDENSTLEYFYTRLRTVTAPDNINLITETPSSGQEGEDSDPLIWEKDLYNNTDLF